MRDNNKNHYTDIMEQKIRVLSCGCELKDSNVVHIDVGGNIIGIVGLKDILKWFYNKGYKPEDLTGDDILEEVKKLNYIPNGAEKIYKDALLREYKKYYEFRTL